MDVHITATKLRTRKESHRFYTSAHEPWYTSLSGENLREAG